MFLRPRQLIMTGDISEACYRTQGGSHASFDIQSDSVLTSVDTSSSTQWVDLCFSCSLDELDSEILENSAYTCKSPCQPRSVDQASVKFDSIESRLLSSSSLFDRRHGHKHDIGGNDEDEEDFESNTQFGVLMKLCSEEDDFRPHKPGPELVCPLCGIDISQWDEESRQSQANDCLDNSVSPKEICPGGAKKETLQFSGKPSVQSHEPAASEAPVIKWLHSLGLAKYEAAFIQQEIDWDSLQWLTEEDLIAIGINALGPRKKIMQSLEQLRNKDNVSEEQGNGDSGYAVDVTKKPAMNKLITEYFSSPSSGQKKNLASPRQQMGAAKSDPGQKRILAKSISNGKIKDVSPWCSISGTPFRVVSCLLYQVLLVQLTNFTGKVQSKSCFFAHWLDIW